MEVTTEIRKHYIGLLVIFVPTMFITMLTKRPTNQPIPCELRPSWQANTQPSNFPPYMELGLSLPCLQDPTTGPCPQTD